MTTPTLALTLVYSLMLAALDAPERDRLERLERVGEWNCPGEMP